MSAKDKKRDSFGEPFNVTNPRPMNKMSLLETWCTVYAIQPTIHDSYVILLQEMKDVQFLAPKELIPSIKSFLAAPTGTPPLRFYFKKMNPIEIELTRPSLSLQKSTEAASSLSLSTLGSEQVTKHRQLPSSDPTSFATSVGESDALGSYARSIDQKQEVADFFPVMDHKSLQNQIDIFANIYSKRKISKGTFKVVLALGFVRHSRIDDPILTRYVKKHPSTLLITMSIAPPEEFELRSSVCYKEKIWNFYADFNKAEDWKQLRRISQEVGLFHTISMCYDWNGLVKWDAECVKQIVASLRPQGSLYLSQRVWNSEEPKNSETPLIIFKGKSPGDWDYPPRMVNYLMPGTEGWNPLAHNAGFLRENGFDSTTLKKSTSSYPLYHARASQVLVAFKT